MEIANEDVAEAEVAVIEAEEALELIKETGTEAEDSLKLRQQLICVD